MGLDEDGNPTSAYAVRFDDTWIHHIMTKIISEYIPSKPHPSFEIAVHEAKRRGLPVPTETDLGLGVGGTAYVGMDEQRVRRETRWDYETREILRRNEKTKKSAMFVRWERVGDDVLKLRFDDVLHPAFYAEIVLSVGAIRALGRGDTLSRSTRTWRPSMPERVLFAPRPVPSASHDLIVQVTRLSFDGDPFLFVLFAKCDAFPNVYFHCWLLPGMFSL
jgi:hypothetical protein